MFVGSTFRFRLRSAVVPAGLAYALLCSLGGLPCAHAAGELTLTVVDADTRQPIACRMHITDEKGRSKRASRMPFWQDHFVIPGTVKLKLPKGTYQFAIERGPEYVVRSGYFVMENLSKDEKTVDLQRAANLAEEGWWSGDLHIHRPVKDIELLMQAEDLHIAPIITWTNKKNEWAKREPPAEHVKQFDGNRYYDLLAGEDKREGGSLLYFRLPKPLDLSEATREFPSPLKFVQDARSEAPNVWVDVEKPFWKDLPVWLASGKVNSIELCNDHMGRDKMKTDEAWGKPRDRERLPDPHGNGIWSQEIFYNVLNCGLRIPPSAGSGSGVSPNPVGYNRVYAWVDKERFNYETWWEAFKAGRVFVTNGPLVRPVANSRYPGHVFQVPEGETLTLDVALNLTLRDKVSYVELIKNGRVAESLRFEEIAQTGHFSPLRFDESGWFLVRAVADVEETYRFGSSGAWYVEVADKPKRVSRRSAEFFLDWAKERAGEIKLDDPVQQAEVIKYHDQAIEFWQDLVEQANAD